MVMSFSHFVVQSGMYGKVIAVSVTVKFIFSPKAVNMSKNWDLEDEHGSRFMRKARESPFVPVGKVNTITGIIVTQHFLKFVLIFFLLFDGMMDHSRFDFYESYFEY